MIRRLIILLLIVVGFAHEEMGELEKQMLYKQNDRSPLLAGLCAFTPTVGHLYLGEWNERLIPEKYHGTGMLSLGVFSYYAAEEKYGKGREHYEKWRDMEYTSTNTVAFIFLSWYFFTIQDAIYLAYQHNADLYEEIYGREYIRPPKKSLIQKWIDKKEAKKKDE